MKRLLTCIVLSLLMATVAVPVSPATAQSDGDALCAAALGGTAPAGYTIVSGTGGGGSQVVLGTDGPDTLSGGGGNDILCGFASDDVLAGGGGNDILVGGPGADQLYGGGDNDTLYGDPDDTALQGGSGRNQVFVAEPEPPPPPAAISFRVAIPLQQRCFADVLLAGFTPGQITVETYVATDANGTSASLNQTFLVTIAADGTGAFTDSSVRTALIDRLYYQVRTGDFASPWTQIDCV